MCGCCAAIELERCILNSLKVEFETIEMLQWDFKKHVQTNASTGDALVRENFCKEGLTTFMFGLDCYGHTVQSFMAFLFFP